MCSAAHRNTAQHRRPARRGAGEASKASRSLRSPARATCAFQTLRSSSVNVHRWLSQGLRASPGKQGQRAHRQGFGAGEPRPENGGTATAPLCEGRASRLSVSGVSANSPQQPRKARISPLSPLYRPARWGKGGRVAQLASGSFPLGEPVIQLLPGAQGRALRSPANPGPVTATTPSGSPCGGWPSHGSRSRPPSASALPPPPECIVDEARLCLPSLLKRGPRPP